MYIALSLLSLKSPAVGFHLCSSCIFSLLGNITKCLLHALQFRTHSLSLTRIGITNVKLLQLW